MILASCIDITRSTSSYDRAQLTAIRVVLISGERTSSATRRKAYATVLAEAGASEHEIASVTGHQSLEEIERYTRAAERKRLADRAMKKFKP